MEIDLHCIHRIHTVHRLDTHGRGYALFGLFRLHPLFRLLPLFPLHRVHLLYGAFPLCLATALVSIPFTSVPAPAAWIWVEGEKPAKSSMNRHPWWYDQVRREELSGQDLISNFHEDKAAEAEYLVDAPTAGTYQLWVRANPVQASLSYRLGDGEWKAIQLGDGAVDSINIAADGKIDLRFIAWAKAGEVKLRKGENRIAFRMDSANNNHGYLDCFVLTTEPFSPRGALKPGEAADVARGGAASEKDWFPFDPGPDPFAEGAPLDLRHLNETVAGESGFIAVKGSEFAHSKTGKPIRFWGVNGPAHEAKGREALRSQARFLAKRGVNLVRIHGGYFDESGDVKMTSVKHAIEVVEEMKAEGIYSHFSIYFPLWLTPKPDSTWLRGYDGKKKPFAALYFNQAFQAKYRSWWKALLTTASEKTGRRLVDEPAVAGLEIINEDSFFFWTFNADAVPDPQLKVLEARFGAWLKRKYGSIEAALETWKDVKAARDAPAEGRIGFRPLWDMFRERTRRDQDTARFLVEVQRGFYEETYRFLRDLGFKGVITASNWATASPEVFGPIEKYSYTACDFIDRHGYFGCRHKGDAAEWSIRDGHTYADRSALRFDPEERGKPKSFVHPIMDPSYDGKPSMISETTFTRPNRYRSEAPLFYSAYGALQGTDAVVHFALDSTRWAVKPGFFMQPWTLMSPAMMGQFPAAALIYRKGLVSAGDILAEVELAVNDILDLKGTPLPQDAAFDELRAKDVPRGTEIGPGNVIDPLIHFAGRANVSYTERDGKTVLKDLKAFVDRERSIVTSTTGELRLDYSKGLLAIDAAAAQGACGALKAAGAIDLKTATIASDMEIGSVVLVSLDDRPLATSSRILLQAMSEEKAAGFETEPVGGSSDSGGSGKSGKSTGPNDSGGSGGFGGSKGSGGSKASGESKMSEESDGIQRRIRSIGRDPWLVREIRGTVKLRRPDAAKLAVTRLDANGGAVKGPGDLKDAADNVKASEGMLEIRLEPRTLYYVIAPAPNSPARRRP